ncbi:MlaD family protein [Bdellovibrio sp. HCB337]|uniref:MlaD family protein n=1 Tax=Bdellovibrio sp. HCB337 TaxID=3394358 RepID=UPI0039A5EF19
MAKFLKSNWYVWLFPVFAILISIWLFMGYLEQRGPDITIRFEDAASLRAEKTRIRYRGVVVGTVQKITISEDHKNVIVHATLQRDSANFAVEGSRFWIVTPKMDIQGVRGLETLFEGPYISVLPGTSKAKTKTAFIGQATRGTEDDAFENTTPYYLESPYVESISAGDPVTFRGLTVGTVSRVTLTKTSQMVSIQINIEHKYTKLIRTNTVFWRKIGVQAKLGLFSSDVKIESLESLLRGGIDLFTPEPAGPMAKARSRFALSASPPKGWETWNPALEFESRIN